jgi:threonine/homoserine/homoserine lactone efflux protein
MSLSPLLLLAVVAHEFATLFTVLKFAGAAYLLYLAWGMATSRGESSAAAPAPATTGATAFFAALSLTLGNPKVIVFFLSIMPLAVDLDALTPASFAELAGLCVVLLSATLGAYALAANRARRWLASTRAMRITRRATVGVIAGVALAVATR